MDARKVKGIIAGVIASIFFLFPVFYYLHFCIVPHPPSEYSMTGAAYGVVLSIIVGSNIFGISFAVFTKKLMKRSIEFGVIFISLGPLNSYVLIKTFPSLILPHALSIMAILVGGSLILPERISSELHRRWSLAAGA